MENFFFGEWVFFEDENEKKEAYEYLRLWKKFLIKKYPELKQIGSDQICLKENINILKFSTLGIKIEMGLNEDK